MTLVECGVYEYVCQMCKVVLLMCGSVKKIENRNAQVARPSNLAEMQGACTLGHVQTHYMNT